MSEVSDKQFKALVAEVKKNPGNSERHYSEQCGIPMNQIGKALWEAEVVANPSLGIQATPAGITKAVKAGSLRWPRIAAYAGISVGQAKKLYEQHTGEAAPSNITARGRKGGENGSSSTSGVRVTQSGRRGAPAGTSGRRGAAAAQPAAGRRGAAVAAPAGRRGTRAGADPK